MSDVNESVDALVVTIRETVVYQNYIREKERVQQHPQLKAQIDEYRKQNFELQNMTQDDELFDRIEQFQNKYEDFLANPLVADFLKAELAFCRMMQDITGRLIQGIDFE